MILKMANEDLSNKNHSDFSIDHILNKAGGTSNCNKNYECDMGQHTGNEEVEENSFSWLQCTRFCPPKIPRVTKKEVPQRRQLGRYPRIPFTTDQLSILEEKFRESPYLSSEEASNLSKKLQLADAKVKIWFQNRRARKRREEMGQTRKNSEKVSKSRHIDTNNLNENPSTSSCIQQNSITLPLFYLGPQNIFNFGPT